MMQKVIFIPGLGENAKAYYHQLEHLKDLIEPVIFEYDAYDTTDHMAEALLEITAPDCALVGHSMGGFLAQKCAAQTKIRQLVLINTWAKATPEFIQQNQMALEAVDEVGLEALLRSQVPMLFYDQNSPLVQKAIQTLLEKPPKVYKRHFQALANSEDLTEHLPHITASTLIIHGRQDRLFSLEQHLHMHKHIPGSKLTIIEESGHVSPIEQPQAVTALLRLFLGK